MNRNEEADEPAHDYDIVEVPVANDKVQNRINDYLGGTITKNDFPIFLTYKSMNSILDNRPCLSKKIEEAAEVAGYLWQKGWAERNGGNITVNITAWADDEIRNWKPISEEILLGRTMPNLKDCYFSAKALTAGCAI